MRCRYARESLWFLDGFFHSFMTAGGTKKILKHDAAGDRQLVQNGHDQQPDEGIVWVCTREMLNVVLAAGPFQFYQ